MFLPPDRFWYECSRCGYAVDKHDLARKGKKKNKQMFHNFCKECASKKPKTPHKGVMV